jgi:hypothetical protein
MGLKENIEYLIVVGSVAVATAISRQEKKRQEIPTGCSNPVLSYQQKPDGTFTTICIGTVGGYKGETPVMCPMEACVNPQRRPLPSIPTHWRFGPPKQV